MIYYTADLHLGHENIIKLCKRPFSTVEEMDEILIANWNSRITKADTVYVVGDMIFKTNKKPENYFDQLKGKKYLIIGNHDSSWIKNINSDKYFQSVERMSVINSGKCKLTLCHYPMMSFEGKYLIYGHIHANRNAEYWSLLQSMENALNAGVEVNHYQPVTFDELITNNIVFRSNKSI